MTRIIPARSDRRAFTTRYPGRSLQLVNDVVVFPFSLQGSTPPKGNGYKALYDTGATFSAVSPRVVADLGLPSIGTTTVSTPKGMYDTTTHLVNIKLPNDVTFRNIRVTKAELNPPIDVLIGMDLIGEGDFAVTHHKGNTTFSYCWPSHHEIDFILDVQAENSPVPTPAPKRGRNDPCWCNSGKKYKKCHGK